MTYRSITRFILLLLVPLLLAACVLVDDFGTQWDEGRSDFCIDEVVSADYAKSFERAKEPPLARSFSIEGLDGIHFLMLKNHADDKGGHLYRYRVVNNIFIGYRPSPTQLKAFHEEYPDSIAKVSEDKVELADLSDASLAFLAKVAADDSYWVDDVRKMYNPTRKAECTLFIPTDDNEKGN